MKEIEITILIFFQSYINLPNIARWSSKLLDGFGIAANSIEWKINAF